MAPPKVPSGNPTPDEKDVVEEAFVKDDRDTENAQLRLNKQCYLLRNIEPLMQQKAAQSPGVYEGFTCLTGLPEQITNKLVAIKGIDPMFDLTTAQHAVLQPRIRLFKVEKASSRGTTGDRTIEFKFDANLQSGVKDPNNTKKTFSIRDMVRDSNYRGSGAGIKSVSYELAGVDPATSDRLINLTLGLHFKSIGDLFQTRGPWGFKYKFSDLINRLKARIPRNEKKAKATNPAGQEDERFQIRAVIGWADPPVGHPLFNKKLRAAIQQSKRSFSLQLVDHTLKYNQDGTVELDIDYIASLDYMMSTSELNVLWMPFSSTLHNVNKEIKQSRERLSEIAAERARLRKVKISTAAVPKDAKIITTKDAREARKDKEGKFKAQEKEEREKLNKSIKEKEKLEEGERQLSYSRIFEFLLGLQGPGPYVRRIMVDPDEIGVFGEEIGWMESDVGIGSTERKVASTATMREISLASASSVHVPPSVLISDAPGVGRHGRFPLAQANYNRVQRVIKANTGDGSDHMASHDKGTYIKKNKYSNQVEILFFYLGDLIEILLRILSKPVKIGSVNFVNKEAQEVLKEIKILLGPIVLRDNKNNALQKKIANMADIPISFDLFENWFIFHVVRRDRTKYDLRRFINDVMKNLIGPSLGSGCFAGERQESKVATVPLEVAKMSGGAPRIPQSARCRINQIRNLKIDKYNAEAAGEYETFREKDNVLYFYMVDSYPRTRTENEKQDRSEGIYHLKVGAERGIVLSIEFEKTDIPFLREARITNDAALPESGFLREKYDAKIKLVGNTFFAPGQLIYVKPSVPGYSKGATKQQLQNLGFGGYYLVTKVNHILTSEYNQTELVARWQFFSAADDAEATRYAFVVNAANTSKCGGVGVGYAGADSLDPGENLTKGRQEIAVASREMASISSAGENSLVASGANLLYKAVNPGSESEEGEFSFRGDNVGSVIGNAVDDVTLAVADRFSNVEEPSSPEDDPDSGNNGGTLIG